MTGNTRLYGAVVITIAHFHIVEPARGLSGFVIGSAKTLQRKSFQVSELLFQPRNEFYYFYFQ